MFCRLFDDCLTDDEDLPAEFPHLTLFIAYSDSQAPAVLWLINPVFDRL